MKRKLLTVLVVALVALMVVAPAFAAYSTVTGTVRNSKTGGVWTHGGSIAVYDCADIGGTDFVSSGGTFSGGAISASLNDTSSATFLCIEITFNNGGNGTPAPKFYFYSNSPTGTLALGNIYTDTGPTALELTDFSVTSQTSNTWLPFVLLVGSVALVGGAVAVIRKRRA